jgi:ribonuclease HII
VGVRVEGASVPHAELERSLVADGCRLVAGVDEVGRGAWAGPVSVGVALVDEAALRCVPGGLRDSKALGEQRRAMLAPVLVAWCRGFAVGHASPAECDDLGMTAAQQLAARRAFRALGAEPDAVVVDGPRDFTGHHRALALVGGDGSSVAVAAASVLAKVTRDRLLVDAAARWPEYGFERNKGYPTPGHRRAVERLGMTSLHRRSWTFAEPVRPG